MKVNKRIPVQFESVEDIDERFQKVKIWLMHLGKNYNNSIFTREAVEGAMETLKNTPILGYVEESKLGEKDFRGHEHEIVVEDGKLKSRYLGSAYGVIPENCNPRFEKKLGDFGEELEYLVVDGLLWTKFDDAISILTEHGEVAQSMELHEKYDGYWNDENSFVFTNFLFDGACMLGQDVLPAMQKASVESYSTNVFNKVIEEKMSEYRHILEKHLNHSKEVQEGMTLEELLAKYSITEEKLAEKGINVSEFSLEDLEEKIKEAFSTTEDSNTPEVTIENSTDEVANVPTENQVEDNENPNGNEDISTEHEAKNNVPQDNSNEDSQNYSINFELSHDDIRRQMWDKVDTHMIENGFSNDWYYIVTVYDTNVIVENDMGNKFYKLDYSKENDEISFGNVVEVHPMFLTSEEKGALELMRSNFQTLETENAELKEFKSNVLKEEHQAKAEELFTSFSKLEESDYADLKENVHNFSIEEIEGKLFERLGRKMANFSTKPKETSIKLKVTQPEVNSGNGGYLHVFKKHGIDK